MNLPHISDGVLYPKGVNMMILPFASHRNPKYFSDPLTFIPERFQGYSDRNPYIYCPFSAGSRNCIGKFSVVYNQ